MQAFLSTPLPLMPLVMKESMTPRESDTAVGQEPTRGSMDSEGDAQARPGLFAGTAAGTGGPRQRAGEGRALTSGDRGPMPQGLWPHEGRSRSQCPVSPARPPGSHWEVLVPSVPLTL